MKILAKHSFPCLFQPLKVALIPWLMALHCSDFHFCVMFLLILILPNYKVIGFILCLSRSSPHLMVFNLITSINSLFFPVR